MAVPENLTTGPATNVEGVNKLAVVVGVNNSIFPNSRETLQGPERDAYDMALTLEDSCSFKLVQPSLRGQDAKTGDVQQVIINLAENRTEHDFLLFYFSGHAEPIELPGGHRDIYLVTHDFKESNLQLSPTMHISMRWLREILYRKSQAGAVLLILDCCYAGNIFREETDPYHIDLGILIERWLEETTTRIPKNNPRLTLTATGYNVTAQEKNGHGLMTSCMLRALRGVDDEAFDERGQVDIISLHKYLKAKIPEQYPDLAGELGQFSWILASHPQQSAYASSEALRASENILINEVSQLLGEVRVVTTIIRDDDDFYKKRAEAINAPTFDYTPCKGASFADLDLEKIMDFLARNRVQGQKDFRPNLSPEDQLEQFGFLRQSYPTFGTLLCFGKDPKQWIPSAYIHCKLWQSDEEYLPSLQSEICDGNLLRQFELSSDFLKKHLRLLRVFDKENRADLWEIPFVALQEALANALIHRDYVKRNDAIDIDIFDDRIEISSPGDLFPPMTEEVLQSEHASIPRNPQITRTFYLYGYVEHAGSGVRRMQEALKRERLPPPEFNLTKEKRLKVTFYRPKQGSLARSKEKQVDTSEDRRHRISRRTFWISLVGVTVTTAIISGESIWLITSRQIAAQQSQLSRQQIQISNLQSRITQLQQQLNQLHLPRLDLNFHRITLTIDYIGILNNASSAIANVQQQLEAQPILRNRQVGLALVYGGAPSINDVSQAITIANKIYSILALLGRQGFAFTHASYYDPLYQLGTSPQIVVIDIYLFEAAFPTITGISPTSGLKTGGTTVVIIGTGFTGTLRVSFSATAASGFTVDSDAQITAISPTSSGTVDITVTTPSGTSTISPADQFTYR